MNFLELAQRVASDSGTVSDGKLTTVVGQSGRLGRVVRWTNDAWRQIQNAHDQWLWMRGEFEGDCVISQQRYTGAEMSATRHAEWLYSGDRTESRFSLYDPAIGVADEGQLRFLPWDTFYVTQLRGPQVPGKPRFFSVDPAGLLCLSPVPDAAYKVRGPYRKDVQELTADADIPEMPTRFHTLIVDVALMLLGTFDEAAAQLPLWQLQKLRKFSDLERDQLPRMTWPETFA